MKKTITSFLLTLCLAAFFVQTAQAQCSFTVTASDSTICAGDSTTLSVNYPGSGGLTTTLAGGNNHRGNMFDVTAINTVTITQFDGHPMSNTTVEVYYKTGTYVGSENTPGSWTLLGSASVTAQPFGTPTPYPIPVNITIPAGQTYAFYVTSSNTAVSQNYTDGSVVGNIYASDANIQFKEGCGIEYPFSGGPFSPRIWNGVIHYAAPSTFLWSTGDTTQSIVVAPTLTSTYSVDVTLFGCSTASDSVAIEVNSPSVNLGNDLTLCLTGQTTLDAGAGFETYLWSTADTTQTIDVDASLLSAGDYDYVVTVTDSIGCSGTDSLVITISSCADLNDLTQGNDIQLYPNPVNSNLNIVLPADHAAPIVLSIVNELGEVVKTWQVTPGNDKIIIPVSDLTPGIYLVHLQSEDMNVWKKIVKK